MEPFGGVVVVSGFRDHTILRTARKILELLWHQTHRVNIHLLAQVNKFIRLVTVQLEIPLTLEEGFLLGFGALAPGCSLVVS